MDLITNKFISIDAVYYFGETGMIERTLLDSGSPVTQSIEGIKALLEWRKMPTNPMPDHIELPGKVFLVLSSKKDVYYTTTRRTCSCPAQSYHPGERCKHKKKFFTGDAEQYQERKRSAKAQSMAEVLSEHDKNLHKMPANYQNDGRHYYHLNSELQHTYPFVAHLYVANHSQGTL